MHRHVRPERVQPRADDASEGDRAADRRAPPPLPAQRGLSPRSAVSHPVRRLIALAVSLVAIGAVVWWVARQDAPQLPDSVGGWLWALAALAVYATALTLRGWRWHRIMT